MFDGRVNPKILLVSILWTGISMYFLAGLAFGDMLSDKPSILELAIRYIIFLPGTVASALLTPINGISMHIPFLNEIWLTSFLTLADALSGIVFGLIAVVIGYFVTLTVIKSFSLMLKRG